MDEYTFIISELKSVITQITKRDFGSRDFVAGLLPNLYMIKDRLQVHINGGSIDFTEVENLLSSIDEHLKEYEELFVKEGKSQLDKFAGLRVLIFKTRGVLKSRGAAQ